MRVFLDWELTLGEGVSRRGMYLTWGCFLAGNLSQVRVFLDRELTSGEGVSWQGTYLTWGCFFTGNFPRVRASLDEELASREGVFDWELTSGEGVSWLGTYLRWRCFLDGKGHLHVPVGLLLANRLELTSRCEPTMSTQSTLDLWCYLKCQVPDPVLRQLSNEVDNMAGARLF